jgi:hypothetical protein
MTTSTDGLNIATLVVVSLIFFVIVAMMLMWIAQGAVVIERTSDRDRLLK